MSSREDQPDLLFVVHDGDQIVVACDMPGVDGAVEETASGAVEVVELVPYPVTRDGAQMRESRLTDQPPGVGAVDAWYGVGAVVGVAAGGVAAETVSAWFGVPLMLATVLAAAVGYRRRRATLREAWGRRHRVLRHADDTRVFTTARLAGEEVIDAWPRIGAMVGVADPGPVLAGSLWTLSEVLVRRGTLREQRDELEQVRADLPTDTDASREVDDRLARLDSALADIETQVGAQLAAFTDLAERCQQYVREETAIARARDAVLRADQTLGEVSPHQDSVLEAGHELANRTSAVLDAYRELNGNTRSP